MFVIEGASAITTVRNDIDEAAVAEISTTQDVYRYAIPNEFRFDATLVASTAVAVAQGALGAVTTQNMFDTGLNVVAGQLTYTGTFTKLAGQEIVNFTQTGGFFRQSSTDRPANFTIELGTQVRSATTVPYTITLDSAPEAARVGDDILVSYTFQLQQYTALTPSPAPTLDDDGVLSIAIPLAMRTANAGSVLLISFGYNVPQRTDGAYSIIYPADRCSWSVHQSEVNQQGYYIGNATFYSTAAGAGQQEVSINLPRLGVIGKSGRFVQVAR